MKDWKKKLKNPSPEIFSKKMKKNSGRESLGFFPRIFPGDGSYPVAVLDIFYLGGPNKVTTPNKYLTKKINNIDYE